MKGTWNLNSGKLGIDATQSGWKGYIAAAEVGWLYADHEVACHSVTHPVLCQLLDEGVQREILEDRRRLDVRTVRSI